MNIDKPDQQSVCISAVAEESDMDSSCRLSSSQYSHEHENQQNELPDS